MSIQETVAVPVAPAPVPAAGVSLASEGQISIGRDVVGRDKIEIHAEPGATVIFGAPASPAQAGAGLQALAELVQRSAEVREAVIAFRTDFEAACSQVDTLGDYKDLHDLLHQLQFQCYNLIVPAAARFPDDEMALENLIDYRMTLEGILAELRAVAAKASVARSEVAWFQDVEGALKDLTGAIDTTDPKLLKNVLRRLNRVLSIQPTRINTRLNEAARALRLPSLVDALTRVHDHLQSLSLEADKVQQFEAGLDALSKLGQALQTLVEDHEGWQAVDVELRRIEALIDQDLSELLLSWTDLKGQAESLYVGRTEEWVVVLHKDGAALDEGLTAENPVKAKRAFRSYRRRVGDRFHRVDLDLKSLCGELRQVGGPLASVLRMIE